MTELVIRYVHFVGLISLSSMLVVQNLMMTKTLDRHWFKKLLIIDGVYGFSAMLTLSAGLGLWLWFGKPSEFYTNNIIFQIKLSLFLLVAIMSIPATVFFIKNRNIKEPTIEVPPFILRLKRVEIGILVVIPMLAVLMARGIGLGS
jgi:putative membrane protein